MSSSNRSNAPTVVQTPVPLYKVLLLGTILLANNTSIWMIFSFLPFMVSFYYPALPITALGFEAGILGSAFSAGGLIGNFISGIMSDRVGRRPALLWGLMGTAVSSLCFGFSPTFWFAVASRFMWGVLNGNIGVAKTYLAEISDDTNLARSMAYFGVIGSIGRVVGPIIGGLLSFPARTYPSVFEGTVFEKYPFALPSMVVSANCLVIFAIAFVYLPETLNMKLRGGGGGALGRGEESAGAARGKSRTSRDGVQYSALQTTESAESDGAGAGADKYSGASTGIDDSDMDYAIELPSMSRTVANGSEGSTQNPLLAQDALHNSSNNNGRFALLAAGEKRFSGETDEESIAESKDGIADAEASNGHNGATDQAGGRSPAAASSPPPPPSSPARKAKKKSISFSSRVRVKVIDLPHISYMGLKQVAANEVPLPRPQAALQPRSGPGSPQYTPTLGGAGDGSANFETALLESENGEEGAGDDSPDGRGPHAEVRYSNGSEFFESMDSSHQSVSVNLAYLLRQRNIVITTTLYGASSFITIIGNEVFTLWVVTSYADGGLGYSTQEIGTAVMACGVIGTALQLTLYPVAVDHFGVLAVQRYGSLMLALSSVLIPMVGWHAAHRSPHVTLMMLVMCLTLQTVAATWSLVSMFVLISNSCYSHQLATVNGIGQTCASIGRLSGPYLGSVLFAWSETNGLQWPMNQCLVFYVLCVLSLLIHQYSYLLPRSIQRRRREPKFRTWEEGEEYLRRMEDQRLQQQPQGQKVGQQQRLQGQEALHYAEQGEVARVDSR